MFFLEIMKKKAAYVLRNIAKMDLRYSLDYTDKLGRGSRLYKSRCYHKIQDKDLYISD